MISKLNTKNIALLLFVTIPTAFVLAQYYPIQLNNATVILRDSLKPKVINDSITVSKDINIEAYFSYMDSLVKKYDTITNYPLTEHLLVRHNPWLIDTLANTDYYKMKAKDSFVYDQKKMIVIRQGQKLKIPDSIEASVLLKSFGNTLIDINIPEFKLRIYTDSIVQYVFPIRVGQNKKKYLAMNDRITDLRTKTGTGKIIRHQRDPDFYNPVDGKQFYLTKRDDNKTTVMPQIPWIEAEINGIRNGQLIHPTTNPKSLGKAYSNGCIGTTEADAWIIYYYAPIGTKIKIRYDLKVKTAFGKDSILQNIYNLKR